MLQEKKFHYKGKTPKPKIQLTLKHLSRKLLTDAVVDSGADFSIFDASIAEQLGLPYTRFEQREIAGIHGNVKAHFCTIQARVIEEFFNLPVAFVANYSGPFNILGRKSFFEKHVISFNESKLEIIIKKNPV